MMTSTAITQRFTQTIRSTPVLVAFSLVYFHFQFNSPQLYTQFLDNMFALKNLYSFGFFVIFTLIWFLFVPAITSKLIYKESLREMGLRLPENKPKACVLILVAMGLLIPWTLYFARLPSFQSYSMHGTSLVHYLVFTMVLFPCYYIAEEFFFRGFLFLGLWKRIGWHSFWVTDIVFTYLHLGKPGLEIIMCIPASIIFNALTLFTRSIYPSAFVHTLLGITLSVTVTFR